MKPHEIENWALRIIERVERRQPFEDSRVELKAEWLDPPAVARRIAGHANAAGGEPILKNLRLVSPGGGELFRWACEGCPEDKEDWLTA